MATASALWQPREEGLREICALLEAHISPNSDQARIWQQLQHYAQFPDFNNYLVFLLARGEGKSFEVRQVAGLLLKNNLPAAFVSMPPASQQYIKTELLPCIGAANKAIRSTVGTVVSVLFQIVRVAGWIELFQALHQCLDSNDVDHMEGAMDAIYKICEDVPEELDVDVPGLSERPINIFMPRMLQFFQSPNASLRKLALGCINQYIVVMPSALYMSMDQYLQGLFSLVKDPSADVRKLVCSAWVQLIEVRPSILEPHLKNVTELILQANKDSDDELALEACEFWSAYCDVTDMVFMASLNRRYIDDITVWCDPSARRPGSRYVLPVASAIPPWRPHIVHMKRFLSPYPKLDAMEDDLGLPRLGLLGDLACARERAAGGGKEKGIGREIALSRGRERERERKA